MSETTKPESKSQLKKRLFQIVKLATTVGVFWWLIATKRIDFEILSTAFSTDRLIWIVLSFIAGFGCIFFASWRWNLLLRNVGTKIPVSQTLRWTWIGMFFAIFTPGGIGGDVSRGYNLISGKQAGRMSAVSSVLLDRVIGFHSMLVIGVVVLIYRHTFLVDPTETITWMNWLFFGVLLVGMFLMVAVFFSRRISKLMYPLVPTRFRTSYSSVVEAYRENRSHMIPIYSVSLINAIVNALLFYFAALALSVDIPIWVPFIVVPLSTVSNLIPLTLGGLGIGESVTSEIFIRLNLGGMGAAIALYMRMTVYLWAMWGGVLYLKRMEKNPKS